MQETTQYIRSTYTAYKYVYIYIFLAPSQYDTTPWPIWMSLYIFFLQKKKNGNNHFKISRVILIIVFNKFIQNNNEERPTRKRNK